MRRRRESSVVSESLAQAQDVGLSINHPLLVEHLVSRRWDDEEAERQTSTLLIFCEDARWKGCLHDRAEEARCFVSGETLAGVLEALEQGLREDRLDWRPAAAPEGKRRGRA